MSRKSGAADPASTPDTAEDLAKAGRLKQIRMVAGLVHKANPKAMPIVIGSGLGTLVILVVVGLLIGLAAFLIPLGVLLGVLVSTILFGRFAQAAQYSAIEGQPGAAAAVLENMRGNWTVTPAIAANRNMDVVHRAVGRAGRHPGRRGLPQPAWPACSPRRRSGSPGWLTRCPSSSSRSGTARARYRSASCSGRSCGCRGNLKPDAVSDINHRLKALQPSMQAPKGPIPRNVRQPKMPRPKAR